ncbi:MAG: phosphate acyltransferase PlsX [Pseudomonadota bacterium]
MKSDSGDIIIALDVMGGDHGPTVVLPGAAEALAARSELRFVLFGDEAVIAAELEKLPALKARSAVHHTEVAIAMDDKPSQAIRRGRKTSSMWQAIDSVKQGEAHAAVSAGNTGALMAMAKVVLKTTEGVSRPAIAGIWPTQKGRSIALDMGATVGADADQLVSNAIMGAAMARCLFGIRRPMVGLLNIGVEEVKGVEAVREAGALLREADLPLQYEGFVEGTDIGSGKVDVIVTEGFSGNIALKTAEGTAQQIVAVLREEMSRTVVSKIAALFAKGAFSRLKKRLDPRTYNGGVFLGLNGVVVKSHGGTDSLGFSSAIHVAADMVANDLVDRIDRGIELAPHEHHDHADGETETAGAS